MWLDLGTGQRAFAKGDYATAFKEWLPLAKQGNVFAQSNIGFLYYQGLGVPQDYDEAVKWSRKAAVQGDPSAMNNLGGSYEFMRGVRRDYVQALMWYTLAAEHAWKNQDIVVADVRKNRDRLAAKMKPADVSKAQKLAREWLEKPGQ